MGKEKVGEKLEIIIRGDHGEEAMIEAVERVLHLLREGYVCGEAGAGTWDSRILYGLEAETPEEMERRGGLLAEVFKMKKTRAHTPGFETAWGWKAPAGVFAVAKRLIEEGE